ncbi:MAG: hypothetical protein LUC31_00535 [Coprobacillus sp.]|nr:hypothetical protein [Coprobacillus sp.]
MKSGKFAKIATVCVAALGLAACNGGTSEEASESITDSILESLTSAEISGSVVIDAAQTTTFEFTGSLAVDLNNIDNIGLDLDASVTNQNGKLPFGLQYVDNVIYGEYNKGLTDEIDFYLDMASWDDVMDILDMFGVSFDLDLDGLGDYLYGFEWNKGEKCWEMDISGTSLFVSGTKKGEFTGDLWCTIEGANATTVIEATVTPVSVLSFSTPKDLTGWAPLSTLITAATNSLVGYKYYEFNGYFDFDMDVDYSGLSLTVNLGFENVNIGLLLNDKGMIDALSMDFDLKIAKVMSLITINGNEEDHYFTDGTNTITFGSSYTDSSSTKYSSVSVNNIHYSVYWDGEYMYMHRSDDLTLKYGTNVLGTGGTSVSAKDEFYKKVTLSYFGSNFTEIFVSDLFNIADTWLSSVSLGGEGGMSFDLTTAEWQGLVTELSYEEAHTEVIVSEVDGGNDEEAETETIDVSENFKIGVDLTSLLWNLDADGNHTDNPIPWALVEIDLTDYGEEETKMISSLIVTGEMFGGQVALGLDVDIAKCTTSNEDWLAGIKEYAAAHAEDPENEWVKETAYPIDSPLDISTSDEGSSR